MIGLPFSSVGKNGSKSKIIFLKKTIIREKNVNGESVSLVGISLPPFKIDLSLLYSLILQHKSV